MRVLKQHELEAELQVGTVDMTQVVIVPDVIETLDFDVGFPEDTLDFAEPDVLEPFIPDPPTEDWAL